jgi:hypothetical protein
MLILATLALPALCVAQAAPASSAAATPKRPNVLIWIMDDVGFGQPSPFGGPVDMPSMQAIADRGLRFTNFHSTAICSSSHECRCSTVAIITHWAWATTRGS